MSDILPQLGLIGLLVLANAVFAGSELALVSLREGQIQRLEERGRSGAAVASLARDPNRFLATIQIGITLAGFLASAVAAVSLADPIERRLDVLGRAAGPVSIVSVTLVLAYLTLVLGELVPKRLAMQRAERWSMVTARPLGAMAAVTRPVVWLLSHSTNGVVRLLGGDPSARREAVTVEEIRELVASQTTFSPEQRVIIDGAFEVSARTLREVLVPRGSVFVVDATTPADEALRALAASGHTRAPVASAANLDDVLGVVHLRELLAAGTRPAGEIAVDLPMYPETALVLDTMRHMQTHRTQMALVINEHGGAEGIVTIEDFVEELVGEIYDETDRDIIAVLHREDGSMVVPGRFPVHDLPDLGVTVPEGAYTTVAGFVLDRLGRLPSSPGDVVDESGVRITVTGTTKRAITEVTIQAVDERRRAVGPAQGG